MIRQSAMALIREGAEGEAQWAMVKIGKFLDEIGHARVIGHGARGHLVRLTPCVLKIERWRSAQHPTRNRIKPRQNGGVAFLGGGDQGKVECAVAAMRARRTVWAEESG